MKSNHIQHLLREMQHEQDIIGDLLDTIDFDYWMKIKKPTVRKFGHQNYHFKKTV